ncbi:MAG TPA: glycosyltransferase [Pyrinomonadaceae bacterium]|nr:glycosyltransferase [Pyrinomonadaceae bacterium]
MTENGLVSIVIPCYNQAHFLGEAIESILNQTYQNFEIIVVNDGSTDNTSQVAKSFPKVEIIEQDNAGLAQSRNNGLERSNGEFIVFLDSDDKLFPNALEIGVKYLNNRPECAFVSGLCERISQEGNPLTTIQPIIDESDYYEALLRTNYIWAPSNPMYRRSIFEKISGYNTELSPAADYEIYLRIARQFPIYHHAHLITEYRQHQTSMSKKYELMLENVLAVLEMQREFVKGNKPYQEALKFSISSYKHYYLEGVCYQAATLFKKGEWSKSIKQLLTVFRYPTIFPGLFFKLLKEKLERMRSANQDNKN